MASTKAFISNATQVSTGANTDETDLVTGTITGGTLGTDLDTLYIRAFGNFADNANGKRLKFYWDGNVITDTGAQAWQNQGWQLHVIIIRRGATSQSIHAQFIPAIAGVSASPGEFSAEASTLSGDVPIKITGTNSSASAGDITFEGWFVQKIGAP